MSRTILFVAVSFVSLATAGAQDPRSELTGAERTALLKEVAASKEFATAIKESKKVVPVRVRTYTEAVDGKPEARFAEVLHFNYADGRTIRTVYNRTDGRIVRVESLEAYPTPLADSELARAKQIAEKSEARAEFVRRNGDRVEVTYLAPVIADPKHPLFGKRLVTLIYRTKADPKQADQTADSLNVQVNLTDEELVKEPSKK